jgi:hypothetical protein
MKKIEKKVNQMYENELKNTDNTNLINESKIKNEYCFYIDKYFNMMRDEPSFFDDSEMCSTFPIILSNNSFDRIKEKFFCDSYDLKKITEAEIFDAIVQIDFFNEYGKK